MGQCTAVEGTVLQKIAGPIFNTPIHSASFANITFPLSYKNINLAINAWCMVVTYHLDETELDECFYRQLKAQFKNKKLSITIAEEADETEYLLANAANAAHLLKAIENSYNKEGVVNTDMATLISMTEQ